MSQFIIGAILYLVLLTLGIAEVGNLNAYIDIPTIIIDGIGAFLLTLMSFSCREIWNAFKYAFHGTDNREDLYAGMYLWKCVLRNLLVAAGVGNMVGAVIMLARLEDPAAIGPATAVCVLTTLYALILAVLLPIPAMYAIKRRLGGLLGDQPEQTQRTEQNPIRVLAAYILYLLIVLLAMGIGGNLLTFIDIPSMLIVFGGTFAISIVVIGVNGGDARSKLYGWQFLSVAFFVTALVGAVAGFVAMTASFTEPSEIGPAMAIVLLSPFYALLAAGVISFPMEDKHAKATGTYETFSASQAVWYGLPLLTIFWLIAGLTTLFFSITQ